MQCVPVKSLKEVRRLPGCPDKGGSRATPRVTRFTDKALEVEIARVSLVPNEVRHENQAFRVVNGPNSHRPLAPS